MNKNVIYYRSVCYAMLLVIFIALGYIFLDSGFNTKTRIKVDYEDKSGVIYNVDYIDNVDTSDNDRYITNMVDNINFKYKYENVISEYINGYYRYSVDASLVTYEKDKKEILWKRDYSLVKEKTVLLDANNINSVKIADSFDVDFDKFKKEIDSFVDTASLDVELDGYLIISINILESLSFSSLDNVYDDTKVISINIPLTQNTFKIDIDNVDSKNSCYEFVNSQGMNIVLLIIGAFCMSVGLALFVLVIRQVMIISDLQNKYQRDLKKILSKYDDCIVRVKRFYVNKKYNMIYVDSFEELLDVYDKKNKMISFKEVKRGSESIFVIIDGDDAWIYRLF